MVPIGIGRDLHDFLGIVVILSQPSLLGALASPPFFIPILVLRLPGWLNHEFNLVSWPWTFGSSAKLGSGQLHWLDWTLDCAPHPTCLPSMAPTVFPVASSSCRHNVGLFYWWGTASPQAALPCGCESSRVKTFIKILFLLVRKIDWQQIWERCKG